MSTLISIFIASRMANVWPAETVSPALTITFHTFEAVGASMLLIDGSGNVELACNLSNAVHAQNSPSNIASTELSSTFPFAFSSRHNFSDSASAAVISSCAFACAARISLTSSAVSTSNLLCSAISNSAFSHCHSYVPERNCNNSESISASLTRSKSIRSKSWNSQGRSGEKPDLYPNMSKQGIVWPSIM